MNFKMLSFNDFVYQTHQWKKTKKNALSYDKFPNQTYWEIFLEHKRMRFYYERVFAMREVEEKAPVFYNWLW